MQSTQIEEISYATSSDELRKGYTGYEKDSESGLDFAQARYYSSTHGRYTSVDPLTASASIRDPQTFNRYSYVLNSPYKFTDHLDCCQELQPALAGNGVRAVTVQAAEVGLRIMTAVTETGGKWQRWNGSNSSNARCRHPISPRTRCATRTTLIGTI